MAKDDQNDKADPGTTGDPKPTAPATVTLKMPDNVSSVSVAGVAIEVKNGLVRVEHWIAAHLREVFGATDVPTPKK